jgi:hypothetical protein
VKQAKGGKIRSVAESLKTSVVKLVYILIVSFVCVCIQLQCKVFHVSFIDVCKFIVKVQN